MINTASDFRLIWSSWVLFDFFLLVLFWLSSKDFFKWMISTHTGYGRDVWPTFIIQCVLNQPPSIRLDYIEHVNALYISVLAVIWEKFQFDDSKWCSLATSTQTRKPGRISDPIHHGMYIFPLTFMVYFLSANKLHRVAFSMLSDLVVDNGK